MRLDWPCASSVRTIGAEHGAEERRADVHAAGDGRADRDHTDADADRGDAEGAVGRSGKLDHVCSDAADAKRQCLAPDGCQALSASLAARAAAAAAASTVAAARAILLRRPRRGVLRPLDQLLRLDERPVLVLRDQLQADPPAGLVDLLDDHVEHVAALDHVLDVADPARADVRDVEQAVGALLQLDERAELGRLDDLAGVLVADLGLLRDRLDRLDRRARLRRRRSRR